MDSMQKDNLKVEIYDTDTEMGQAAAVFAASKLIKAIKENGKANLILATGASQFKFYRLLKKIKN